VYLQQQASQCLFCALVLALVAYSSREQQWRAAGIRHLLSGSRCRAAQTGPSPCACHELVLRSSVCHTHMSSDCHSTSVFVCAAGLVPMARCLRAPRHEASLSYTSTAAGPSLGASVQVGPDWLLLGSHATGLDHDCCWAAARARTTSSAFPSVACMLHTMQSPSSCCQTRFTLMQT
jgi:hypothetical protein